MKKAGPAVPFWALLPLGIMAFSAVATQWAAQQLTPTAPTRLSDRSEGVLAHYVGVRRSLEEGRDADALAALAAAPEGPIALTRFGGDAVADDHRTDVDLFLNVVSETARRAEIAALWGREARARTWLWHSRVLVRRLEAGGARSPETRELAQRLDRLTRRAARTLRDAQDLRIARDPRAATFLPGV